MLFEPRIGLKPLAALCRRLAIALGAGVDVRNVWSREAANAHGPGRRACREIADAVAAGGSIGDGLAATGNYFPEFFRELVEVGEQTGHLPEIFRQLADHYDHQLKLRRQLLSSLTWPMFELTMALGVVGLVILLMGVIPQLKSTDMLGLGLRGVGGLVVYLLVLGGIGTGLFLVIRAGARGQLWAAPIQKVLLRTPQLGRALETLAIARLAWAMHVTMNSGMEIRQALRLSLRSTHNVLYTCHTNRIIRDISAGREIYESLRATRAFPPDFLDAVQVGEDSGQLVESMGRLADAYQDQARVAMNTLNVVLGMLIWLMIMGIIVYFIYQFFVRAYLGPINDALNGKF